jgi:hypothetical protein
MSNQVFSGPVPRFFPSAGQVDKFTLLKNVVGPPALGYTVKAITKDGVFLFFDELNDQQADTVSGIIASQNVATRPYWTIAQSTPLGGAVVLWSAVDNVIAVTANLPCWLNNAAGVLTGAYVKFEACVMDPNNSFAVIVNQGLVATQAMDSIPGAIAPLSISTPGNASISTVIEVKAGYVLGVRAILVFPTAPSSNAFNLVLQDDLNSTGAIQTECSLSFQKL